MAQAIRALQNPPKAPGNPDGEALRGGLTKTRSYGFWYIHEPEVDEAGNYLDKWGRPIEDHPPLREQDRHEIAMLLGPRRAHDGLSGNSRCSTHTHSVSQTLLSDK